MNYNSILLFLEPFKVAFVKTMYTVTEGQSSVEVCVNLTHPNKDIGDEVVYVEVYDNSSSIHIPAGVALASKSQ